MTDTDLRRLDEGALQFMQTTSCFGPDVCRLLPCPCAESLVERIVADDLTALRKRVAELEGQIERERQRGKHWLQATDKAAALGDSQ